MATDILLDSSGDLDISSGTLQLTTTKNQLATQQIRNTLSTYRGEWVFDTDFGVPYLANDNNDIQIVSVGGEYIADYYIREAILSADHVERITKYEAVQDRLRGSYDVAYTVITTEGEELTNEGEGT